MFVGRIIGYDSERDPPNDDTTKIDFKVDKEITDNICYIFPLGFNVKLSSYEQPSWVAGEVIGYSYESY